MESDKSAEVIFDVGAHKGEDSDFYLKLGYRVVAVEASPDLAAHLRARFQREVDSSQLTIVQKAIAETAGVTAFYVNTTNSVWGTANPEWLARNKKFGTVSQKIEVESVVISDLFSAYGCPTYLKIDIEGADMQCLRSLKGVECRPQYISIESSKTSWAGLLREFDALRELGYSKYKISKQGRYSSSEFVGSNGRFYHEFEEDASGPFGEHLEGRWLTRRQALARYLPIFFLYKTVGDHTAMSRLLQRVPPIYRKVNDIVGWYDTHAKRD